MAYCDGPLHDKVITVDSDGNCVYPGPDAPAQKPSLNWDDPIPGHSFFASGLTK